MNKNILLSICIPTFNRGEILIKTLNNYINDPAFDERVEIVISDNCSTDQTEQLVDCYVKRYDNIRYQKLNRNGADLNMSRVLSMGNGLYLKLMNDSVTLKSGVLQTIINIINLEKERKYPIFFYQNIAFLNSNKILQCNNINELISNASFWTTWIANFGIWKNDFETLEDKDRLAYLQFPQTDWTYRIINSNEMSYIYFGDFYSVQETNNKGNYNVFKTFGINYLSIFDDYTKIKTRNLRKEEYRLFRYFLLGWYKKLVLENNDYSFDKQNAFSILREKYGLKAYFYLGFFYLYFEKYFITPLKAISNKRNIKTNRTIRI